MPDQDSPKPVHVDIGELPRKRSEKFCDTYGNHTEATSSFYECRLIFSVISKDLSGAPTIEERVAVDMTWEHAARVRDMLDGVVKNFEKQYGNVRAIEAITPKTNLSQP